MTTQIKKAPVDWDNFIAWYKAHGKYQPRSWRYEHAPRWLWYREYKNWHSLNKPRV